MRRTGTEPTRRFLLGSTLALGLLLQGCAVYLVDNQVQSFARWDQAEPAGSGAVPAPPQTFRFDRLPSQRDGASAAAHDKLENLTRAALARVGWNLAEAPAAAHWVVQVQASTNTLPRAPWEEPWYPHFGFGLGRFDRHWGGSVFMGMSAPYHERQVSVLIREVRTGQVVYETSARHDGRWSSTPELWNAMLEAALRDFPAPPAGPRQVNVEVPR